MTPKERQLLEAVRRNPMISQNELAESLGISRAAVSVHISHLMKKGHIVGRGYVLNEDPYVLVIGAANLDIVGRSENELILKDSNIGNTSTSSGGVGRNIAENLSRLHIDTKLIAALGGDVFGETIKLESKSVGIDMEHCCIIPNENSNLYIAILDSNGEMTVALNNMKTSEKMSTEHILRKRSVIERAYYVVLDCNLSPEVIEVALTHCRAPVFMDGVSSTKVLRAKPYLRHIDTLKINILEAESLCEMDLHGIEFDILDKSSFDPLKEATAQIQKMGVRRIFVTMGSKGVFWRNETHCSYMPVAAKRPINATGAGDAFLAGLVYASMRGMDDDDAARNASALSQIALDSSSTVSSSLSPSYLETKLDELPNQGIFSV